MKSLIIVAAVGLLFFMTCTDRSNLTQCNIYQTNIDVSHELFTHQLSDGSYHYLFGVTEKDKRDFRTKEITIERAKVGDENNWTSFSEMIPGICQTVCQTKENIYLISRQQYQERQDPNFSKHKLYRISKEDGTIVNLCEWDKGNSFIRDVYFDSEEKGFVLFRPSGNPLDYQIFSTVDGGKKWNFTDINKPVGATQSDDNNLYFLSYKRNDKTDWIYSIDKKNNTIDSLQLDLNITDFAIGDNGGYWLLGKDGEKTKLQHYQKGKAIDIKTFSEDAEFFPEQLYKYNDLIVVLASQIDKSMLGGFGGTKPEMYLSKNGGLTWGKQSLEEALYIKSISFYKDERMTAYIGHGKVLSCSLK